ncbi:hypothetical protein MAHJHV53_05850 [Mycobacterium avium subsp. hominissuis]
MFTFWRHGWTPLVSEFAPNRLKGRVPGSETGPRSPTTVAVAATGLRRDVSRDMASDRPDEVLLPTRVEVCFCSVTLLACWPVGATDLTSDRIFADDIREDLDLPLLELGWNKEDLANGFQLSGMVRGYRTLRRADGGPVAAAPDETLSLLVLVPLSHFLRWSLTDLKRSFLSPEGKPLLRDGRYAVP